MLCKTSSPEASTVDICSLIEIVLVKNPYQNKRYFIHIIQVFWHFFEGCDCIPRKLYKPCDMLAVDCDNQIIFHQNYKLVYLNIKLCDPDSRKHQPDLCCVVVIA